MPIVCRREKGGCGHILEEGSGPTIHKLCIHCIRRTNPGADLTKLKPVPQADQKQLSDQDINDMISESEAANMKKKNEIEFSIMDVGGVLMAHFKIIVPSTGKSFELAFNKEQLMSFINEIEAVEKEDD